jgi:hypothetical protein
MHSGGVDLLDQVSGLGKLYGYLRLKSATAEN